MPQFNVMLPAGLADAVRAEAKRRGMSGSEYVSRVLSAALGWRYPGDERLEAIEDHLAQLDRRLVSLEELANRR